MKRSEALAQAEADEQREHDQAMSDAGVLLVGDLFQYET